MSTKKGFTPVLLHRYEDRITSTSNNAKDLAKQWNKAIEETESILNKKLTNSEKIDILTDGFDAVMSQLRVNFQFKNASDAFNLESQGIDLTVLKNAFANCKAVFDTDSFEIKNDKVQLSEKGQNQIITDSCVFTTNARQNKVYEMAKKLSCNLNEALHNGIISKLDIPLLERSFQIITQPMGSDSFVPDFNVISRLNSTS